MSRRAVVVGAGMGGLTAALRLASRGMQVTVLEARSGPGGLAAGFELEGLSFDAGPYILLDRPGLDWAFRALGLELSELVPLRRVEDVYEVVTPRGERVRFRSSLEETAAGLERDWPGSGRLYRRLVERLRSVYRSLQPLLFVSRPGPLDLVRSGALLDAPFLLRSLAGVLEASGLPEPVREAIGIWTHVAGQRLAEAPSPLAFVPALIHTAGAWYPIAGIGAIPVALETEARRIGVDLRYGQKVRSIRREGDRASGVETEAGEVLSADAVVSDAGLGTYLALDTGLRPGTRRDLESLPLQSPGVCAYLAVRNAAPPPYLRFRLPADGKLCRLLVSPTALAPAHPGIPGAAATEDAAFTATAGERSTTAAANGWHTARLVAPMERSRAEHGGAGGQRAYLEEVLSEGWWQEVTGEHRVLATRIPADWGAQYNLYRESMNPVMTARFMRRGRLAHRSPHLRGLYLAGSATHPGQWVSFCAVSGVLAADLVLRDFESRVVQRPSVESTS